MRNFLKLEQYFKTELNTKNNGWTRLRKEGWTMDET